MAGDIYDILNILNDIRELLERDNNKGNYSNPINNPYVRTVMDSPMVHNIMKTDKKTGEKVDTGVLDFKSLEKSINALITQLHLNNTETRTYIKTAISQIEQDYDKLTEDKQIPYIERSIDALFKEMVRLSSQLSESPLLNVDQKKAQSDPKTQEYLKFYKQQLSRTDQTNTTLAKIFEFFGRDKAERKSRTRQFIDDLADGLGKSKFIGGAIIDLIRLATFFAANWLKQFGPIGKALAVALVALGPVIGTAIVGMLTKALPNIIMGVFKWGFTSLGALLKTVFLSLTNRSAATSFIGGKAMSGLVRGGVALGLGAAAYGVGKMAVDTWKEGGARKKTAAVGLGIGSAVFGVGAIATLLAPLLPALAPIAPIAIAVGAIATAIGLMVKFWPQIVDFFKMVGEKLGIIAKKDEETGEYKPGGVPLSVQLTGGKKSSVGGSFKTSLKDSSKGSLSEKELQAWNLANSQSAQQDVTGAVTNWGHMTQEKAGSEADSLWATDSKFREWYEKIPFDKEHPYLSKIDFSTDLISADGKYAYLPKGTYSKVESINRERLKKDPNSSLAYITSGIGTAGKYATKKKTSHSTKDHFLPVDAAIDLTLRTQSGGKVTSRSEYGKFRKDIAQGYGLSVLSADDVIVHGDEKGGGGLHAHVRGYTDQYMRYRDLLKESSSEEKKNKEALIEAAKTSVAVAKQDYEDYVKEAKENDGRIDEKEKKVIEEKRSLYDKTVKATANLRRQDLKEFKGDFTANEVLSSILKDTLIVQQFQKQQQ